MIRWIKEQVLMLHVQLIESTGAHNEIHDNGLLNSTLETHYELSIV